MRGSAVWSLLSGASVLLMSALGHAQCTKDIDCKGDRVCEGGKCVSPAVLPPAPPPPPGSQPEGAPESSSATAAPASGAPSAAAPSAPSAPPASSLELPAEPAATSQPLAATAPLGRDEPEVRRRSRPAMVAGIVMVSVGPLALLGALAAKNAQERCDSALDRDYPDHRLPPSERYRVDDCNAYSVPLYVLGIGGGLLAVAGIPLIVYGAKSQPRESVAAGLRVLPWGGRDSAGLRLRLDL